MVRIGRRGFLGFLLSLAVAFISGRSKRAYAGEASMRLRLLSTTDIHAYLAPYDYYRDALSDRVGLARVASLITSARAEVPNTLLFDNGDLLEGGPLGAYIATEKTLKPGDIHPAYKAMNVMGYDAATLGNHDFNYGMMFLDRSLAGAAFPYVCANVYRFGSDSPYYRPYVILDRVFTDSTGKKHTLHIGVLGVVTPQIVTWARRQLEGHVTAGDMVDAAKRYVPEMRARGSDVIVMLAHTGLMVPPIAAGEENAGYALTQIPGIDAVITGHLHRVFPDIGFAGLPNFDASRGTLNGVPVVMAGFYGSHLGVIDLDLQQTSDGWRVQAAQSAAWPLHRAPLAADKAVMQAIETDHQATLDYIRRPVGTLAQPLDSYFALAAPSPLLSTIAQAQLWAARRAILDEDALFADLAGLPLLAAVAPSKAGGRGGADSFTSLDAGPVSIGHIADLYPYPNVLEIVLIDGVALVEWLEMSASLFRQIKTGHTRHQSLIDYEFPTYDFDVMHGIDYTIDVTLPARYHRGGGLADREIHRIGNVMWQDKPVSGKDRFLVATNNYRASGGGSFPGLNGGQSVFRLQDSMQTTLVAWLQAGDNTIAPPGPWRFTPFPNDATVIFQTSPDAVRSAVPTGFSYLAPGSDGFAAFQVTSI